jgi:hypothetical protein
MPIEASVLFYITCAISVSDTVDSAYVARSLSIKVLWFADCNWQKEAMMQ